MKRNLFRTFGFLVLGLTLFTSSTFASPTKEENLRTRIGLKAVSEERMLQIEKQINEENPDYDEDVNYDGAIAKACSYPYYDYSLQYLEAVGYKGSSLILSDGSVWVTKPSDGENIQHWPDYYSEQQYGELPAEVYITTNNNWFFGRDYKYRIVNKTTGESALVNMSQGPISQYAFFVWNIDSYSGFIELVDANGTYFILDICYWDKNVYSDWMRDDCIILGRNSRWNASSNPYLLINVTTLTNARACAGR